LFHTFQALQLKVRAQREFVSYRKVFFFWKRRLLPKSIFFLTESYVCMCVCVMSVCVYVCMYVLWIVCMRVWIVCVYVCMCVCMYVWLYVCVYVGVYVCMCMYVCMSVYVYVCMNCVYMCICVCVYVCMNCVYACMCVCMCEDPVYKSRVSPADRPGDINSLSGYPTRLGTMRWTRVCRLNRKVTPLAEDRRNDEFCMSTETFTAEARTGAVLNIFHLTVIYFTKPDVCLCCARQKVVATQLAAWLRLSRAGGPRNQRVGL